jgi:hypothetical protein
VATLLDDLLGGNVPHAATLDQEQKTAAAYAEPVTDVERWLQRSQSDRGL